MNNLAELILDRAARRPSARFGMADAPLVLAEAATRARRAVGQFAAAGLGAGSRVAVIGHTDNSYLLTWLALQLAGCKAGLINPALPDDLLAAMLQELQPDGIAWVGREPGAAAGSGLIQVDATGLAEGRLLCAGVDLAPDDGLPPPPGLACAPEAVAGYMHTSGTSGVPKFCVQTQRYYLRLGRFIADSMAISPADVVFAPLPMFHVNPLGYGVVGGLTGGAELLGARRFSASGFWPTVKAAGITVAFLHAPPVAILNRTTTAADAAGHRLRAVFLADETFLETFQAPLGYACYGSTEAGGLCHIGVWRLGDRCPHPEGMSRSGNAARCDVEWRLADDGEILVRGRQPHVLASGYRTAGGIVPLEQADGWFHTGDVGRLDDEGRLIFVERRSESIRVKGEYVPIGYVESRFAEVAGLDEVAIWRRDSELAGHEVVLYVVAEAGIPTQRIQAAAQALPPFMRPVEVIRIAAMPRLAGVGKISRRQLPQAIRLESREL